jgi:hypothetical protein
MLLGILAIAAIVAVWYLVSRLINRGSSVLAGAVTGNTRNRGLAAVHTGLRLALPVTSDRFVDRLVETLELGATWRDGMKLAHLSDDKAQVVVSVGNRMSELAKYRISLEPTSDGCQGDATVVSWREVEGRIPATETVERINQHIRAVTGQLGGNVVEFTSR